MNQELKGQVRRVPAQKSGIADGVEADVKCTVTTFTMRSKKISGIGGQRLANCRMMASYDEGTVSVSVRGKHPFMVTVRMDELMAVLKEAADYHHDNKQEEEKGNE